MEFDPNFYNDFTDSIQPANKLINIINGFTQNKNSGIILDIGCGTGSTTKLLNELNCDQIIGCDIDPKMVAFAQKYNKTAKIDYLVQDFATNWQQFDERLKKLSGKVSIIFTNYAMGWIWDKETAAKNIARLLAPNGRFVGNILYDGDIFAQLPETERQKAFKLVPYPSEQQFIGGWIMALKSAGLIKMDIEYWEPKIIMSEMLYTNEYVNIPLNWFKHYSNVKNGLNHEMERFLKKLILNERCKPLDVKTTNGQTLIEIVNRLWQIIGQKAD